MLFVCVALALHVLVQISASSRIWQGRLLRASSEQGRPHVKGPHVEKHKPSRRRRHDGVAFPDKEACAAKCSGGGFRWKWSAKKENECTCEFNGVEAQVEKEPPDQGACATKCHGAYDWKWNSKEGNVCSCVGVTPIEPADKEACAAKCYRTGFRWRWSAEKGNECTCERSETEASIDKEPPNQAACSEKCRGAYDWKWSSKEGNVCSCIKIEARRDGIGMREERRYEKAYAAIKARWVRVEEERKDVNARFIQARIRVRNSRKKCKAEMEAVKMQQAQANKLREDIRSMKTNMRQKKNRHLKLSEIWRIVESKEAKLKTMEAQIGSKREKIQNKRLEDEQNWKDALAKIKIRRNAYRAEIDSIEEEQRRLGGGTQKKRTEEHAVVLPQPNGARRQCLKMGCWWLTDSEECTCRPQRGNHSQRN